MKHNQMKIDPKPPLFIVAISKESDSVDLSSNGNIAVIGATQNGSGITTTLPGFVQAMEKSLPFAIGANLNDRAGSDGGHVRIYGWDGTVPVSSI